MNILISFAGALLGFVWGLYDGVRIAIAEHKMEHNDAPRVTLGCISSRLNSMKCGEWR